MPKTSGVQLLKTLSQLVQVGAIRSAKQQQALDQLLQHLGQQLLAADVLLQLPDLVSSLTEAEAAQSQPGLGALIRKLAAVLEGKDAALSAAPPADVLRLVAALQQEPGQLQHVQEELLPGLPAKLLASMRELSAAVATVTAALAAAVAALAGADRGEEQAVAVQEVMQLEQEQKQLMQVLSLREWVSVVEAVKQFSGNTAGTSSILMPAGGEEVALLLQAMTDAELLHYRLQQQEPAVAPAPPGIQQGASSDGAAAAAALLPLPMVFVTEDWQQLARLLSLCLEWYPLDLLPLPLLQLVLEVGCFLRMPVAPLLAVCQQLRCHTQPLEQLFFAPAVGCYTAALVAVVLCLPDSGAAHLCRGRATPAGCSLVSQGPELLPLLLLLLPLLPLLTLMLSLLCPHTGAGGPGSARGHDHL